MQTRGRRSRGPAARTSTAVIEPLGNGVKVLGQLEEHGAERVLEPARAAQEEPERPCRRLEPLEVREKAARLHGEHHAARQRRTPRANGGGAWQAIERVVQLDGVKRAAWNGSHSRAGNPSG